MHKGYALIACALFKTPQPQPFRRSLAENYASLFKGLAEGETRLALPALGGLFNPTQCQTIDAASLSNKHLLLAMRHLRWAYHNGTPAPVDYRNMGPEELGSVYESLLELVTEIDLTAKTFGFIGITSEGSTAGNARKTSAVTTHRTP